MTTFELRYQGKTIETEVNVTLEEFVEMLGSTGWWLMDEDKLAIQVSKIDSVKVVE